VCDGLEYGPSPGFSLHVSRGTQVGFARMEADEAGSDQIPIWRNANQGRGRRCGVNPRQRVPTFGDLTQILLRSADDVLKAGQPVRRLEARVWMVSARPGMRCLSC